MTTDILLKPQQLYKEYMSLIMKHDTLKTSLERTVAVISLAPGHGQGVSRRLEEMEAEILDLEKIIDLKNEELMDAQKEAKRLIDLLPEQSDSDLLTKRYVDMLTWPKIAEEMLLNQTYCREKHKNALKKFQAICT